MVDRIDPITADPSRDQPAASFETIQPVPTCVRVWRTAGFTTYQASMDAAEQAALGSLQAGEPFAAICATLEETSPVEEATQAVGSLLLRWIGDGLLARLPGQCG